MAARSILDRAVELAVFESTQVWDARQYLTLLQTRVDPNFEHK